MYVVETTALTHAGAMAMLAAAVTEADAMGQPQCIVIVDASGVELAVLRMTGAKYLSLKSARAKARTAASIGNPSAAVADAVMPAIALATDGDMTRLGGGMPIRVGGALIGGIGVGSGSPDQDEQVCRAALVAIGADAT